jgi:Fe-S cluster assembly iron-binding protein IscA
VFTEGAVKEVFRHRDLHKVSGRWRLRVEVIGLPGGKCRHLVDLDLDPTNAGDFEYDFQQIRVVVARSQINRLRGSSVGCRWMADGTEGFFVHNPNCPLGGPAEP